MQTPTFTEVFSQWQPRYRLVPRGPPLYAREAGDSGFTWQDCQWVVTEESLEEGLQIAEKAVEAGKIWKDANRQIATNIAKAQVLASIPKVFKAKYVALTVCPDHGDAQTMLQISQIVATVSSVLGGKFVIEQRSEIGQTPYGWHIHYYIQTTYAPSNVKNHVQQKLSKRGYVATYYATKADENWLKRYMSGAKGNADKDLKVQHDRILRKQLNIPDILDIEKSAT